MTLKYNIQSKFKFKKKSDKFPSLSGNPNMTASISLTTAEINKLKVVSPRGNLTKIERDTLQSLREKNSLALKPSDKGGNIVIMTNEQYKIMCKRIHSNNSWNKPIARCTTDKFNNTFYNLVDEAFSCGIINKDTWEFILCPTSQNLNVLQFAENT